MRRLARTVTALVVPVLLAAGCSGSADDAGSGAEPSEGPSASATQETVDPDTPTSWGPTVGEVEEAQELVADWTPRRLAGQLIVGRYAGTDPQLPADLLSEHHLAGIQVTSSSILDRAQLIATSTAVADAARRDGRDFPPVLGVDQEGGVVSHLDGIAAEFPSFATAGAAVAADRRRGQRVVRSAAVATGLELRDLGFTWVFAPVADVTVGAADPTIGSRSPSTQPRVAAQTVTAALRGYQESGIVSTVKHFPGHGGATADSHLTLPRLGASLQELRRRDLVPFVEAVDAGAPAVMVGHLDVPALEAGVPSSLSSATYDLLRDDLGFEGVTITDSLGMGAVVATDRPAVTAVNAGADLLLMPADTARTARTVTDAIRRGAITRERAEAAATRVVAMQLWQRRVAEEVPVPPDVAERARRAAADLAAAAY